MTASEPVSYVPQMMMAIIAASGGLLGLTGVVIGQVKESGLPPRRKKWLIVPLVFTLLFGGLAITFGINWLSSPSGSRQLLAILSFGVQLTWFLMFACTFWLSETELEKAYKKTSEKRYTEGEKGWKWENLATIAAVFGGLVWGFISFLREARKKETRD